MELLSKYSFQNGLFVRVRLEDGSLGFLSAFAFSNATLTVNKDGVTLKINNKDVPEGRYQVLESTPWRYTYSDNQRKIDAKPAGGFLLKGMGKRTYKLEDNQNYYEVINNDRGEKVTVRGSSWFHNKYYFESFQSVLDSLPISNGPSIKYLPTFNAENEDLNAFEGCSRSYLESVFGGAVSYAGPALSEIPGYTYALYDKVRWKIGKKEDEGIIVFYDSDLRARRLEKFPIKNTWGTDPAPLIFPKQSLAEPDPDIKTTHWTINAPFIKMRKEWSPVTEKFSQPSDKDRFRIAAPLFFERSLGVSHPLAILGIMIALSLLWGLAVTVWVKYIFNYGSNGWAGTRCYLLMLPIVVVFIIYLWRYPLIFFIFGSIFLLATLGLPYGLIGNAISYKRCPKCHRYCEPEILEVHEGKFHGDNYTPTPKFEQMEVFRNNGELDTFHDVFYYKYETKMSVTQKMSYDVKCPDCGHKWTQNKVEKRPDVLGPILIVEEHDVRTAQPYKKVTTTKLKDGFGNTLSQTEEVENGVSHDRDHYKGMRYDYDFYKPYFIDYINGDKGAIKRYYKDRWDTITHRDLY